MDPYQTELASRFRTETEVWARGYTHVLYSAFVLEVDGADHLVYANVIAGTLGQLSALSEMHYDNDGIHVFRVLQPLAGRTLNDVLNDASKGTIVVGSSRYSFRYPDSKITNVYFEGAIFGDGQRDNAKVIHFHGPDTGPMYKIRPRETLDTSIKTGSTPFDGLKELLTEAGLWDTSNLRSGCHINLTAPTSASILSSSIMTGGRLLLCLSKSKILDRAHIGVGYIIYRQGRPTERGRVEGPHLEWPDPAAGEGYEGGLLEKSFAGAVSAKVFLSHGDTIYDEWLIEDKEAQVNTLASVYGMYDGAQAILVSHLRGEGTKPGRDFEAAFSQLLSLCGFSSIHIGGVPGMKDRESIDVIASTRNGRLLIVECTLMDLNNDNKLGKLDARYKHIMAMAETSRIPLLASQKVIVSAYRRSQVEADLEAAGKLDAAVVTQDEIQQILSHLGAGEMTADRVFDFIKHLVPSVRYQEPDLSEIMGLTGVPTLLD